MDVHWKICFLVLKLGWVELLCAGYVDGETKILDDEFQVFFHTSTYIYIYIYIYI